MVCPILLSLPSVLTRPRCQVFWTIHIPRRKHHLLQPQIHLAANRLLTRAIRAPLSRKRDPPHHRRRHAAQPRIFTNPRLRVESRRAARRTHSIPLRQPHPDADSLAPTRRTAPAPPLGASLLPPLRPHHGKHPPHNHPAALTPHQHTRTGPAVNVKQVWRVPTAPPQHSAATR